MTAGFAISVAGAILGATVAASFTDWLFFDVAVHRLYARGPDVWRPGGTGRIIVSQVAGTLATSAGIAAWLLVRHQPIELALILWAAGALPIALQNPLWLRLHPMIAAAHALGWLARLVLATGSAALILG